MNVLYICGVSILAVASLLTLKNLNSNYTIPLSIIITLFLTKHAIDLFDEELGYLKTIYENSFIGDTGSTLLKTFGICLITESTADLCRDSGHNSIASKIELIGKIEILVLCLPMVKNLLEIINNIMF